MDATSKSSPSEALTRGLARAARMVLEKTTFEAAARVIFDECRALLGARSGYVALLSDDGAENEVLFLEAGGLPCDVNPDLPMPIRGLRGVAYETGKPAWDNEFMDSRWQEYMPPGHVPLANVLFAPQNIGGKTVGIMGLANKEGDFTEQDGATALAFSELAALALQRSRRLEDLERSEEIYRTSAEALLASEERYRSVVENAREAIVVVQDGFVRYANPRATEYTGYSLEEMLSRPFPSFIHEEDRPVMIERYKDRLAGHDVEQSYAFRILSKAGKVKWLENQAARITWNDEPATLNFLTDVTERRKVDEERARLEARLLHARRMESVEAVASGVARDFDKLLSVVTGFAAMMQDAVDPKDPLHSQAGEILSAGKKAEALTEKLLVFSQRQSVVLKTVDLGQIAQDQEALLRRLKGQEVELTLEVGAEPALCRADRGQLEDSLLALVENAAEALEGPGTIRVATERVVLSQEEAMSLGGLLGGPYARLTVEDTGRGMDERVLARIFEPYFTTKAESEGRGLGLSAAYGVVSHLGGEIVVQSEFGKGSTFAVYLPAVKGQVDEPTPPRGNDVLARGGGTVLFIEEDERLKKLTRETLKRNGLHGIEAADAGEALMTCEQVEGAIDLLVTNVALRVLDGPRLYNRLQQLKPGMKVLYLAEQGQLPFEQEQELSDAGMLLHRPFAPEDLAMKIRKVLSLP